ncbi:hypothetical protein [Rhodovulum strictum]|uniref:Uncharacterized protein n=1 Tax=Rhodovulum strictum TaxID=58314 RepID=A0A844BJD5_9RHOB|nr:hypothetical protein [Rhodovulum strictum]MRH21142.1 hypothetical protein [Rhodovulum strictum]
MSQHFAFPADPAPLAAVEPGAPVPLADEIARARQVLVGAEDALGSSIRAHEEWRDDAGGYAAGLSCPEGKETYDRVAELFAARLAILRARAGRLQADRERLDRLSAEAMLAPAGRVPEALVGLVVQYGRGQIPPDDPFSTPAIPQRHLAGMSPAHLLADPIEKHLWGPTPRFWSFGRFRLILHVGGLLVLGAVLFHLISPMPGPGSAARGAMQPAGSLGQPVTPAFGLLQKPSGHGLIGGSGAGPLEALVSRVTGLPSLTTMVPSALGDAGLLTGK